LQMQGAVESGMACITLIWNEPGGPTDDRAKRQQELGLLIARAEWEQAGAEWKSEPAAGLRKLEIRLPLAL